MTIGDHFYTIDASERTLVLASLAYNDEGIACVVQANPSAPPPTSTALHRLYNPSNGDHFYTVDAAEREDRKSVV